MNNIRIALAHDWLTGMRGGEKCLEAFCELFPDATVFTLVHKKGSVSGTIEGMDIRTSFLQKIPGAAENYRKYLPLYTRAIESFDLSGYDLVLSSSHCVAKGVKSPESSLNLCYCFTPVRYAWKFFDQYFSRENPVKRALIAGFIRALKDWDLRTSGRVDHFIAISRAVKDRISEYYGRDSDVIYPPADVVAHADEGAEDKGYYLVVSALVPYKRIDLAVEAFKENGRRLVVIGSGNDSEHLKKMASGSGNIEFLGWVDHRTLNGYFKGCRALIFPGEEDFGIVPVEAQAYGKPVIAYAAGGALETVVPLEGCSGIRRPTGVMFPAQTVQELNKAVGVLEDNIGEFEAAAVRENAMRFNRDRFKNEMLDYIERKWETRGRRVKA